MVYHVVFWMWINLENKNIENCHRNYFGGTLPGSTLEKAETTPGAMTETRVNNPPTTHIPAE